MVDSPASEVLVIRSHAGPYRVELVDDAFARLEPEGRFVIDARVAELYGAQLSGILQSGSALVIEASERAKSLDRFDNYIEQLAAMGIRRGEVLVAIGGGVIQDITCFIAGTLFRGLEWRFYPTTLLAQADSCIGSKSSINVGALKNMLGTFTPPARVIVSTSLLDTLADQEVRSGIGEMLKVHAIDGQASFAAIARDYDRLLDDRETLRRYIRASLEIKRVFIEEDEFDQGRRNVLNYGHSFGHAIESATDFAIPHGVAVTIGMDMANDVAKTLGVTGTDTVERMRPTLRTNAAAFDEVDIPPHALLAALAKDKKHVGADLTLVLPDAQGRIAVLRVPNDDAFREACEAYLARRHAG
jgi:3-dehydroquinate synthase